jgi:hypothetical protein
LVLVDQQFGIGKMVCPKAISKKEGSAASSSILGLTRKYLLDKGLCLQYLTYYNSWQEGCMAEWFVGFRANEVKFRIGDIDAKGQFIGVIEKGNRIKVKVLEVYSGHNKIKVGQAIEISYESIYEKDGKALSQLP